MLRDWVPWLLISPAVVGLAGLFRFERKTWPRSLLAHLVACFVAVFLYEYFHTLMFPQPPPGMFGGPLAAPSRNTLSRPTPRPDGSSNLPVSAKPDFVSGSPAPARE